jgi:hypothetical protein
MIPVARRLGPFCSFLLFALISTLAIASCGGDEELDSEADARRAYTGFDPAVDRAIALGLQGFNGATSANIADQPGDGDASGSMVVGGQVDQGASANKEMRLEVSAVDYSDGVVVDPETDDEVDVHYDTETDVPLSLVLSLKNIPDGTFTGTMDGKMLLSGDINSDATFALILSGELEADPTNADNVVRKAGTLQITGTVSSGDGTYDVDVLR